MSVVYKNGLEAPSSAKIFSELSWNSFGIKRICYHTENSTELQIMELECQENATYPAHFHDHEEAIQLISGELYIELFDNNFSLSRSLKLFKPREIFIIEKGTIHKTFTEDNPACYLELKSGPFSNNSTQIVKEIS
ncbi:WbuC family cupin fold metalloprotein [Alphaproteobacteria bacterium]|nr:WbuC family cupin fold metalloprotein [Alphaproteobacteria bacterium]